MWNEASAKPCTRILFLQLLLGVLLLGGVFLLAVNEDIAATQRTMVNTVNYVKEQCNRYSRIGLADESKSLMRIVESANGAPIGGNHKACQCGFSAYLCEGLLRFGDSASGRSRKYYCRKRSSGYGSFRA